MSVTVSESLRDGFPFVLAMTFTMHVRSAVPCFLVLTLTPTEPPHAESVPERDAFFSFFPQAVPFSLLISPASQPDCERLRQRARLNVHFLFCASAQSVAPSATYPLA